MKSLNLIAALALAAAFAQTGSAQQQQQQQSGPAPSTEILGHWDTRSGSFRPLAQKPIDSPELAAAVAASNGKFVVKFTINVASTLPSAAVISCTFNASVFDVSNGLSAQDSATVTATRSGSAATCAITMPYSWNLATPGSDSVNLNYYISAGTTTGVSRLSEQSLPSIKVPAAGATTNQTITATI